MGTNFKTTRQHLVLSGNLLEIYEYEKPIYYDVMGGQDRAGNGVEKTEEEKAENRKRSKGRARKKITRLAHANFGFWRDERGVPYLPKFLTLTFRDSVFDAKEGNKEFTKFIKRLNYAIFKTKEAVIRYLAVVEIQPRSKKIHYHVVFFNLPFIPRYIDVFNEAWGNGYIWIEKITGEQNAVRYITKYMTKEDDDRLRGVKSYFCSRGLKKPVVVNDEALIHQVRPRITLAPVYRKEFENEYTGRTTYFRFDLATYPALKHFIEKQALGDA